MKFAVAMLVYPDIPKFDEVKPIPPNAPFTHEYYLKGKKVLTLQFPFLDLIRFRKALYQEIVEADSEEAAINVFEDGCSCFTSNITVTYIPEKMDHTPPKTRVWVVTRFANQSFRCFGVFSSEKKAYEYIKARALKDVKENPTGQEKRMKEKTIEDRYWEDLQLDITEEEVDPVVSD